MLLIENEAIRFVVDVPSESLPAFVRILGAGNTEECRTALVIFCPEKIDETLSVEQVLRTCKYCYG